MAEQKSDLSRAFSEDGALKTHVGGQALIEGIMMRGKYNWSVAVREPDGGIYVEEHDLASGRKKNGWMYWPLVRGCRAMLESLVLGYKALEIAALHAFAEEGEDEPAAAEEAGGVCSSDSPARTNSPLDCSARAELASDPSRPLGDGIESSADADADGGDDARLEPVLAAEAEEERAFSWKEDFGRPDTMIDALGAQRSLEAVSEPESSPESQSRPEPAKKSFMDEEVEFGKKEMAVSMVLGLVLGVVLFIVAPAFITNLIVGEYDQNTVLWNIVDGLLRVGVFVFYLWLIGRMQEIKRMFGYQDHPLLRARPAAHARERAQLPAPARALRHGVPHHGHGHRHLRVHGDAHQRAHRAVGRAGRRAEAGAGHPRAHPADARHRRHLL